MKAQRFRAGQAPKGAYLFGAPSVLAVVLGRMLSFQGERDQALKTDDAEGGKGCDVVTDVSRQDIQAKLIGWCSLEDP